MPPPLFILVKKRVNDKIVTEVKTIDPYDILMDATEGWKFVYNPRWKVYLNNIRVR